MVQILTITIGSKWHTIEILFLGFVREIPIGMRQKAEATVRRTSCDSSDFPRADSRGHRKDNSAKKKYA